MVIATDSMLNGKRPRLPIYPFRIHSPVPSPEGEHIYFEVDEMSFKTGGQLSHFSAVVFCIDLLHRIRETWDQFHALHDGILPPISHRIGKYHNHHCFRLRSSEMQVDALEIESLGTYTHASGWRGHFN